MLLCGLEGGRGRENAGRKRTIMLIWEARQGVSRSAGERKKKEKKLRRWRFELYTRRAASACWMRGYGWGGGIIVGGGGYVSSRARGRKLCTILCGGTGGIVEGSRSKPKASEPQT